MSDVLIFLSFAAFVLSPCFIAFRARDQREEAKLGPRLVPARIPRSANSVRRKLIVDQLPRSAQATAQRQAVRRDVVREMPVRHIGPRSPYMSSAAQGSPRSTSRRRNETSVFIPPTPQIPTLGYTASPVPALVYGLPQSTPDDLLCLLVIPGARAQQRSYHAY